MESKVFLFQENFDLVVKFSYIVFFSGLHLNTTVLYRRPDMIMTFLQNVGIIIKTVSLIALCNF